ncbi:MAG: CusA/CzcA family heavy metal efflux RND transporter [Bacteroidia bacterium]|nr:CusA/CzcA family heavy metal efflux RND transporter [Bacteroidia bacterium]
MLDKIILFSIRNKFIIGLFTLALVLSGIYSMRRLPVDALPDITNNQVQIITTSPALATQEVEQFITYPVELSVKMIPGIVELRSISRFGLSVVTVVFKEDVDIYWARAQISERLKEAEQIIPQRLGRPELAPVSTGLGEIYQYVVYPEKGYESKYSATELRSIQDWIIRPQLIGTPGVAEVNVLGGYLKQYEIAVEPDKLRSMNVTITEIFDALERNNENTGGAYIDKKPYAYFIRGIGMVNGLEDIRKIVVKNQNGIPILIRDVALVREGSGIRYGAVTKDGKGEEVSGMVLMLKGENSAEVVARVKDKMEQIKKTLPEGVSIEPYIDRTKLVNKAISTVETNLAEGALIVVFVLVLLLGNLRAGLVVASVIPLALLFAVCMMQLFGVSGNLMSLGAIDFGLIVDGAVIIVEAIVHRLRSGVTGKLSARRMDEEVYTAASKIRSSAAFGEIIILIVYLPVLALSGIEGKMFKPMAQTVSFAILGAFILSLTYVPMMAALVLKKEGGSKKTFSDHIMEKVNRFYQPLLDRALRVKSGIVLGSLALFLLAFFVFKRLGGEFIPTLDEGDIATHLIISSGSSLSQEVEVSTRAEQILRERFPEIRMIVTRIGSAEIPTDPMPMEAGDMIITLKDKKEWTSAKTKEELMQKMEEALQDIPGVNTEFSQPIQMRFNELMTGVRSDVAIKIFGEDIDMLAAKGDEVLALINNVDGVSDARAERVSGLPQISVTYNKDKLALYGLNVGDLNRVIRMGFAGEAAGVVYEGEKRFDLVVRLASDSRQDIGDLQNLYVTLPAGNQIPLEQVADIKYEPGPMQISREDGRRRIVVGFNVRDRDVQSVVTDIQKKLDAQLKLPPGYYVTYGGQFQNLTEANKRLAIAVPVALGLIFVLLYFTFRSVKQSLLIFTAIPLSAIGGVFALWLRGMPFSISAGVGFIALFGVAVLNGIVLIGYFNQLKSAGMDDVIARIKEGTLVRLRPVLMTAGVASLGFLPMALSHSAGAEVQKPLATVVIGGLISATLLTLVVLPVLYYYSEKGFGKRLKTAAVSMLLLFSVPALSAQEPPVYSLEDAIETGRRNNLQIQAADLRVQAQERLKASAFDMPQTNITGMFGQYNTRAFDQNFSISQEINPFGFSAQKKEIAAQTASSRMQAGLTRQDVIYNIRISWNTVLYLQEKNRMLRSYDSLLQAFVKAAALRHSTGEITLLEKTTAETQQLEMQRMLSQNRVLIDIEKSKLKVLLGITSDFQVREQEFSALQAPDLGDSSLLHNNPALQLALQEVELARAARQNEKAQLYPGIMAGYYIQSLTGEQNVGGQTIVYDGKPRFQGFTAGITLPLFSMGQAARIRSAQTRVLAEQANATYTELSLQARYSQELARLDNYSGLLEYYHNSALPNASVISQNASKSYTNGDISYVEYLQALRTSLDIRMNYIETLSGLNTTVINLRYLLNL